MVLIPVGVNYDVTVTGRVPKLVRCESCGYEYVYLLEKSTRGHGSSLLFLDNEGAQNCAHETANVMLDSALAHGCAVVPCAKCGHVQAHMIPQAQWEHRRWMFTTGICALAIGGIVAAPAIVMSLINDGGFGETFAFVRTLFWITAAVLIACGLALAYARFLLAQRHDPHAMPAETRKAWGDSVSISKDDFLRSQLTPG
jgi:hypothetical protein